MMNLRYRHCGHRLPFLLGLLLLGSSTLPSDAWAADKAKQQALQSPRAPASARPAPGRPSKIEGQSLPPKVQLLRMRRRALDGRRGFAAKQASSQDESPKAPRIPPGMRACTNPLPTPDKLPQGVGETVRYVLHVDGLSVGTIDFKIERLGTYEGQPVTEYRSLFKLDSLVSTFVAVEGRAAALVSQESAAPITAMNRYALSSMIIEEDKTFAKDGHSVVSSRRRDGRDKKAQRQFPGPVRDFVSAYYLLRALPQATSGCTLIYGNQRAYTIWIHFAGEEKIKTPVGLRTADKYEITYGSELSKKPIEALIWVSQDAGRLPYRAKILGKHSMEAAVHLYELGTP